MGGRPGKSTIELSHNILVLSICACYNVPRKEGNHMPEVILTQLIAQATKLMHEQNYDDRIIKYEVSVWRGFQKFCDSKGYAHYSSSCKDEFITELRNSTHPLKDSTIARKLAALKKLDLLA